MQQLKSASFHFLTNIYFLTFVISGQENLRLARSCQMYGNKQRSRQYKPSCPWWGRTLWSWNSFLYISTLETFIHNILSWMDTSKHNSMETRFNVRIQLGMAPPYTSNQWKASFIWALETFVGLFQNSLLLHQLGMVQERLRKISSGGHWRKSVYPRSIWIRCSGLFQPCHQSTWFLGRFWQP